LTNKRRALYKTISWRIIAIGILFGVLYVFNGNMESNIKIIVTANVVATGLYYVHERIWHRWKN